jgi:hypothetical protein
VVKKFLIIALLLFCRREHLFSATIFSTTGLTETWMTVDLEYGCFFKNPFDSAVTTDNQYGAFGAGLTFLSFTDWRNWGLFIHAYFLFPNIAISTKTGGLITTKENIDNMIGGIAGPAFRIMLQRDAYLYFSLGFHFRYLSGRYSSAYESITGEFLYDLSGINIGAGGDIGFKFHITDVFHLDFGLTWMYDIFSEVYLDDPNRAVPKYLWITAKPYLGFGAKISVDKAVYVRIGE